MSIDASQIGKRAWSYAGRPAAGGAILRRVRRTANDAAVPQDGGPAHRAALQPASRSCRRNSAGRRCCRSMARRWKRSTATSIEKLGAQAGHAGRHLQGRPLRHPQPGAAEAAHRQPHRQRGLDEPAGGREGHDLRGAAPAFSASESTKGAGQYFTTRAVIQTMVEVMQPTPAGPHLRPGGRHGRLPIPRLQLRARKVWSRLRRRREAAVCARNSSRRWSFPPRWGACAR